MNNIIINEKLNNIKNFNIFNYERLCNNTLNMYEVIIRILRIYINEFQPSLLIIIEALKNNEYEKIKKIAHKLKGSSLSICADRLAYMFELLEYDDFILNCDLMYYIQLINQEFENLKLELKNLNLIIN